MGEYVGLVQQALVLKQPRRQGGPQALAHTVHVCAVLHGQGGGRGRQQGLVGCVNRGLHSRQETDEAALAQGSHGGPGVEACVTGGCPSCSTPTPSTLPSQQRA